METCSVCGKPAKFFRRKRGDILFACDEAHVEAQGGGPSDWKGVNAAGGALLAAARTAAATLKTIKK